MSRDAALPLPAEPSAAASAVEVRPLAGSAEIGGVVALSEALRRGRRAAEDEARDGFVTIAYDAPTVAALAATAPQIGAVDDSGAVVGYALVLVPEAQAAVPDLAAMFDLLGRIEVDGVPLARQRHYVMGQVAIDAGHRGTGLFDRLYAAHRAHLAAEFDLCVTEIAARNGRSRTAHARVGFEEVYVYDDLGETWHVVVWRWR